MRKSKPMQVVSVFTVGSFTVLFGLALIGWFMNIYKLIVHLPTTDFETLIRIAGIPLAPVGALLGYFL